MVGEWESRESAGLAYLDDDDDDDDDDDSNCLLNASFSSDKIMRVVFLKYSKLIYFKSHISPQIFLSIFLCFGGRSL